MANNQEIRYEYLIELLRSSRDNPRGRELLEVTNKKSKIQIIYNAIQPESYVQPHKHNYEEFFTCIYGEMGLVTFDNEGGLKDKVLLSNVDTLLYPVGKNVWHSIFSLKRDSLFKVISLGPYRDGLKKFAPWAPKEELPKSREIIEYMKRLESNFLY